MNKVIRVLLTLLCVAATSRLAYADNSTEFGVEDDLTVLGTGSLTTSDADVEIKGFTVFGATEPNHALNIPMAPGSIYANGYVQISSGMWVAGSSTFTSTVNLPNPSSILISGGDEGQLMTKFGTVMKWTSFSEFVSGDNLGTHVATKTLDMSTFGIIGVSSIIASGYMKMSSATIVNNAGVGGTLDVTGASTLGSTLKVVGDADLDSRLNVDGAATFGSSASSMTVNGQSYFALGSTFAAGAYFTDISSFSDVAKVHFGGGSAYQVLRKKVSGGGMEWMDASALGAGDNLGTHVATKTLDMNTFGIIGVSSIIASGYMKMSSATIVGNAGIGGTLDVTGASTLGGALNVNNAAYFGSVTKSSFSTTGALDMGNNADITLLGTGKVTLPNDPSAATDAANKGYVDSRVGGAGPWTRDNTNNAVKLSTMADSVGIGIAVPLAKLHVSSDAVAGDSLLIVSSGSAVSQQVLTVKGNGNTQIGSAPTGDHAINMAVADGTALSVAGEDIQGKFSAKFYSGANLAAWIKKK